MKAQRILVTGGAGFLGSYLRERLVKQGHRVLCVDDLSTGSGANGAHLADNPHEFTMIELAKKMLHLSGSRSRLVHKALPSDDPKRRKPDITLARAALGWQLSQLSFG